MQSTLTNSIGAGTFTPKDTGLFTVSGTLNVEQTDGALAALKKELLLIASECPTVDELTKAVVNLESEEFYAMETNEGLARKAGSFENLMGDYAYFEKFLKQIQILTPADLLRVARKYLSPEALTIVMMTPRNEAEIEKSLKTWLKEYGKEFATAKTVKSASVKSVAKGKKGSGRSMKGPASTKAVIPTGTTKPDAIEKVTLSSGARVLFRTDRATQVFSAKAAFLGGVRAENENESGVTELLSRVWTSGTKTLDESEIQSKIENMAGAISAFGGRNSAGLSMQTIAPFENDAIGLFTELLVEPVIAESVVEREKVMMLEAIRSREDNPGQLVSQMFSEMMFKGHPYARDMYGTAESVRALKTSNTTSFLKKMVSGQGLTISIAGNVDRTKWLDGLEKATARLASGKSLKSNFKHEGPKKEERGFKKLEREQTHIIIGYKGLTLDDPRRYALQVAQSVLAGQGGRLFLELRDKASLAYSVSPMRMEGVDTGYFGAYIGCSPNKGAKAIEMLMVEFKKLVDEKISDTELDRAKRYLIGRHDIDLQRNSAISSSMLFNEIYGIPAEEIFEYGDRLHEVSSANIRDLADEIFSQAFVLCAVGPTQPW
jgi:zinc protease